MTLEIAKLFAAAIALFPLIAVGIGLSNLFSSFLDAIGRNPGAKKELFQAGMIGAALTEGIAIFALAVSLIILFA